MNSWFDYNNTDIINIKAAAIAFFKVGFSFKNNIPKIKTNIGVIFANVTLIPVLPLYSAK